MATTGKLNGTTMLLYVDGSAVASCTSHSFSNNAAMRDSTTKDSGGDEEVLPGLRTSVINFDGMVAWSDTYGFDELYNLLENGTSVTLRFSADVSGDTYFICSAYLESLELDAPLEENVTMSGSFHVTGGLRKKAYT